MKCDIPQARQEDPCAGAAAEPQPAFEILRPARQSAPVVVASPHSGNRYPPEFVAAAKNGPDALRLSEDSFVDELFASAPELGMPLLRATLPRAYLDVNRAAYELDPAMFEDPLPPRCIFTPRVAAGLGTIPRVTAEGIEIYAGKLTFADAERRIAAVHRPYHRALRGLVDNTRRRFGGCLLLDAHSMPSLSANGGVRLGFDFILGDRHGQSCAAGVIDAAAAALEGMGYRVSRNHPYAGGFTTESYGAPHRGVHALQIEINRSLYMDETTRQRGAAFPTLAQHMRRLLKSLAGIEPARLEKK